MQETFTITELGNEFGITTRAIRFYEDKQLLSPTRQGNRRIYSKSDRTRLKLLLRGKRLGWPLDEIRTVLNMYDEGHEGEIQQLEYTCRKVRESREQLEQQQRDIEAALADLDRIEGRCQARIDLLLSEAPDTSPES
jgi:DNA-binding transcriptional MerR regulator